MLNVIFIGGLSNGRIVFDYLNKNKNVDLKLTITHPDDFEGPRNVIFPDDAMILKSFSANKYLNKIKEISPDYIFVAGWSELLDEELLNASKFGVIGFHPSKLPNDRGRSVLAWQIEEGYKESALTMFYYNNIPDGGDIIGSSQFKILENDYIDDVLNKVDKATLNLMKSYFKLISSGLAPRIKQDLNSGSQRRLRTDKDDSILDWNQNRRCIFNKIRAISKPYPGAIGTFLDKNFRIFRAEILDDFPIGKEYLPGKCVAQIADGSKIIKVKDGFLRLLEFEEIE